MAEIAKKNKKILLLEHKPRIQRHICLVLLHFSAYHRACHMVNALKYYFKVNK